jgi:hypothetical protein
MYTTCPKCQHHFDAEKHVDTEPFLVIERGKSPWKLLSAYREASGTPKLDEEIYEIAKELFPSLDVASPWRIVTSLVKSGYVKEVEKKVSSRNRLARACVITQFGLSTLQKLDVRKIYRTVL